MNPPLKDVRILALEQFGAGPWATLHLAELGADVIKIEDPQAGGDVGRSVPPYAEEGDSLFFETFNRNKRSVQLDLRTEAGRAVFEDLVRESDAVYSNLRGDQPARLRLTYDHLRHINPRVVCCSLSGFGQTGPRSSEGAYDYVLQALTGWMSLTGDPGGPPTKSGLSLVDYTGGYVSALALVAGLWKARRDGVGCDCDISLFETALAQLSYLATWTATMGYVPERLPHSAHPSIVPFQLFPVSDGWIVVACAKEKFWVSLCGVLGRPDLAEDPRYRGFEARRIARNELATTLEAAFRTKRADEWISSLSAVGVPCARVNDVATALKDPQVEARDGIVQYEHPRFGTVRSVAAPVRVAEHRMQAQRAPYRGEHTYGVLAEVCGYATAKITALEEAGVFGAGKATDRQPSADHFAPSKAEIAGAEGG